MAVADVAAGASIIATSTEPGASTEGVEDAMLMFRPFVSVGD